MVEFYRSKLDRSVTYVTDCDGIGCTFSDYERLVFLSPRRFVLIKERENEEEDETDLQSLV